MAAFAVYSGRQLSRDCRRASARNAATPSPGGGTGGTGDAVGAGASDIPYVPTVRSGSGYVARTSRPSGSIVFSHVKAGFPCTWNQPRRDCSPSYRLPDQLTAAGFTAVWCWTMLWAMIRWKSLRMTRTRFSEAGPTAPGRSEPLTLMPLDHL